MKTDSIDDLLMKMSPELVELYEAKNHLPDGKTLSQVNEEYKAMSKKPPVVSVGGMTIFLLFVTIIIYMLSFFSIHKIKEIELVFKVGSIVWLFFCPTIMFLLKKKIDKFENDLNAKALFLQEFRKVMEVFDNPVNHANDNYSIESIQDVLVTHAYRILDCEVKFDEVRMEKERRVWNILHYGKFLDKCRERLEKTLYVAQESFCLKFKKDDIFKLAKLRLECSRREI